MRLKQLLTLIGARLSHRWLHRMQLVVSYLRLGRWMVDRGFVPRRRLRNRLELFDHVGGQIADQRVLYVEFGVYRGDSIRYWTHILRNPESRLHGFDSFEGLPEDFDIGGPYSRGTFNVGGQAPEIGDPRVDFYKGWFEDTLPSYRPPDHKTLFITLDADLYSSTILALRHLAPWIRPGTFLYFDELSRLEHEPRAFDDFVRESGRRFVVECAERSLNRAVFRCVG